MVKGAVKFWNKDKGFGFVSYTDDDGKTKDIFLHASQVQDAEYPVCLDAGDPVEFEVSKNYRGACAVNVRLV